MIPTSLVANNAEFDEQVEGVKELKRKFEDKEAMIITDLYERHFQDRKELSEG